jgi:hypothetical protein
VGSPLEDDETTDVWLNGNGVLPNTSTCYVYAEAFKLLPHSSGRTVAGLNKTHIVLPNIDIIIKQSEQELLQIQLNSSVHLKEINDVINEVTGIRNRAELDTTAVLENLRQVEPTPSIHMYWITEISICILLLTTSCCCYYRNSIRDWSRIMLWRAVRQPQPQRRNRDGTRHNSYASTVDSVLPLPLNVIATNQSGGEQEEAETELDGNDRAPTPFVSRGRVPVS